LDPHRIGNLISYLEKLQERGIASVDHNTLLLTCYTKIKDESKIKQFIEFFNPTRDEPSQSGPSTMSGSTAAARGAIYAIPSNGTGSR
jgi:hypothetical protein